MDATIVSAMAGVFGSLVGGSATLATAWITQRTQSKRELIRTEIRARERLYGEFIRECSKLVVDSFTHTLEMPETLSPAYEILNRIRPDLHGRVKRVSAINEICGGIGTAVPWDFLDYRSTICPFFMLSRISHR